jgi:spore germination protein YaaH
LNFILYSHADKSIHQRDKKQNEFFSDHQIPNDISEKIIISFNKNITNSLTKSVFGFLPYWEYPTAKKNLRYDLLTHIAVFDFASDSSGNISYPIGWPWTDVINAAHFSSIKIIMCVTCFNKNKIRSIISDSTNKRNFFNNVKRIIQHYDLDGVNIDFENMYSSDEGTPINNFMNELKVYININLPDKEISIDVPPINWSSHWNLLGLTNSCDYIFIMGYDFYGDWSETTGPSSPLTGDTYNISYSLNNTVTGFGNVVKSMPEKLILGIPYYGNEWTAKSGNAGDSVISFISSTLYRDNFLKAQIYGRIWNSLYQVPWFKWQTNDIWRQVWYDDEESIGLKYDMAMSKNLKGIGMWALGYDGTRSELWDLIQKKFSTPTFVEEKIGVLSYHLFQNYPNPFNSTTKIKYEFPRSASGTSPFSKGGIGGFVSLKVYDILGNEVATLVNEEKPTGNYEVEFDGSKISSGIYFYMLKAGGNRFTKKMCLIK